MFEGKVALVTGSSQGIGQVIATKFAEYGADVVVHGLGATDDCKTCQDIRAMGRRTAAYDVDITNVEAVNEMVKDIIAKFGKIDILINNAGMYPAMLVTDVTEKHFDRVIAVNLKGTFFVTQAVVNQSMIPNNYGRIVNISSCDGKTRRGDLRRGEGGRHQPDEVLRAGAGRLRHQQQLRGSRLGGVRGGALRRQMEDLSASDPVPPSGQALRDCGVLRVPVQRQGFLHQRRDSRRQRRHHHGLTADPYRIFNSFSRRQRRILFRRCRRSNRIWSIGSIFRVFKEFA